MTIESNKQYTLSGSQLTDLKDYIQSKGYLTKTGSSAPTTSTSGKAGQFYLDTTTDKVYVCTNSASPYAWEEVGGSGGGSTITMTDTDPGEGSQLASGSYVAYYGGDPIIEDYSTLEVNTGMKWIDGSTIYKKTVNLGTLPSGSKNVAHGISNLAYVIKSEGYATNTTILLPLPYVATTISSQIGFNIYNGNIVVQTGSDRTGYSGYLTLYYTKSS